MITVATLPSVATGAIDIALGVVPAPRTFTLSLTTSSWVMPLGVVGQAAVVPDYQLDFLAGHHVAVLRHVELGGVDGLAAGRSHRSGHRHDQADLDDVLCGGEFAANC